jgi:hypothetical protein
MLRSGNSNRYLEIGVQYGLTFEAVMANKKIGVDPNPLFHNLRSPRKSYLARCTSDVFFSRCPKSKKWDFIFVDGLHTFEQTWNDFLNSTKHLKMNGIILLDDTVPCDKYSAIPDQLKCYELRLRETGSNELTWQGDVFKVILMLNIFLKDTFEWRTVIDVPQPKTIVRFQKPQNDLLHQKLSELSPPLSVLEQDFTSVFVNGQVPDMFFPTTVKRAEEWVARHL